MYRALLALLLAATAAPLAAFFAQPEGYNLAEYPQSGGVGGITWDPAGTDFYADHNGGIRRFDTSGGLFAGTPLFAAPAAIAPAPYASFDALAIDPNAPNDFYVSYSGNFSRMHKLTRTGADAATLVTSLDYSTNGDFVFGLVFVPDLATVPAPLRGQLVAAASQGFGGAAKLYIVDKTTLALTELADVGTTNGSGVVAADHEGGLYTTVPPLFGSFTGALLLKFASTDLAAAVGGTPVAASQASVLIDSAAAEWNISALSARREGGGTFLYYSTYEHSSVYRMSLATGESRRFIQGFGGVADGYLHFAQGGSIAFSSGADDFHPAGGGAVRMGVPFSVYTPGYGSYHSFFLFDPEPVNVAVATLAVTQAPGGVNHGVPFAVSLQALNSGGTPLLSSVGVVATVNGGGQLRGFTITSRPGDNLVVDGLVYTTPTLPETITITFSLAGNPGVSVTTPGIQVIAPADEIVVTGNPGDAARNAFFGVTVELRDAAGQLVQFGADSTREVSVRVSAGPGNLWGVTTVTATGGVARFDTLLLDAKGGYVLEFESPGLPVRTLNLGVADGGGGGSGGDDNGCAASGGGSPWALLLGVLALCGVASRLRRVVAR
ncbi:MAG: hypothetical protein K8I27_03695 [Planctomycetes bacterium]|nr:hypothetical protein [Planctomycetota bacterium]